MARSKTARMERLERLRGRPIEDDLRLLYVTENRTQQEIADLYGINIATVNRWLERFAIPSRTWAHVA
jgi:transposase